MRMRKPKRTTAARKAGTRARFFSAENAAGREEGRETDAGCAESVWSEVRMAVRSLVL